MIEDYEKHWQEDEPRRWWLIPAILGIGFVGAAVIGVWLA